MKPIDSKTAYKDYQHTPRISQDENGEWHVRGYQEAKALLKQDLIQAGFEAEKATQGGMEPVLYQRGEKHRKQRSYLAKFFSPTTVKKKHTAIMESFADQILADFVAKKRVDLNDLTIQMAMRVMAVIVGLKPTPGLMHRLDQMAHPLAEPKNIWEKIWIRIVIENYIRLAFYYADVRPAIRRKKQNPGDDIISFMVTRDRSNLDIWVECIVYGAAGIVTTQEFISAAYWHISQRPKLKAIMLADDEPARMNLLHEILRVEPVIANLYRETDEPTTVESAGETHHIPAGDKIHFHIYDINVDEQSTGECPYHIQAERKVAPRTSRSLAGFGAGPHRCAGEFVALYESDVFLRKLLALEGVRMVRSPDVLRNPIVEGYEFRNYILEMDA